MRRCCLQKKNFISRNHFGIAIYVKKDQDKLLEIKVEKVVCWTGSAVEEEKLSRLYGVEGGGRRVENPRGKIRCMNHWKRFETIIIIGSIYHAFSLWLRGSF